ncbi:Rossmann-like and DUF2520 domain-containing protein [Ruegeria arenilitoris]|uniref:Rossmann-like and DUF2520 domain-containing protein n=1 Tax=Ruegeria arenilitoris TaxID=1173585 RepID=UPI0014816BAC|nr:Rossmann-like and DUF2520 domain-containing protein [Ruegeria arenilitoris]
MKQISINLIGAGRVGRTFLHLLAANPNCRVQDVLSANYSSAQNAVEQAGAGRAVQQISDLRPAELWIIAVPDTQIAAVAADLADGLAGTDAARQSVAFHCSGFFPAAEMDPLRRLNWHLASVHPVLSFADPVSAKDQFRGALCGLEGDEAALAVIQPVLEQLAAECFAIRSEGKSLYHAAAVISNNFTVVLQAIAREAWKDAGVADDIARRLNEKLLDSTAENVRSLGPQQALTGPAARGDEQVVVSQGQEVARWHPEAGEIYRILSKLARAIKTGD